MTLVTLIVALAGLTAIGIVVYLFATRRSAGANRAKRSGAGKPGSNALPLETRETRIVGIDGNSAGGAHRQKLIRQCRPQEHVRLVRVDDHPDAVAVHRADGQDIGFLPRQIATEIAGYLDSGATVTAKIRAIEPHETDRGEILSGVRLEITPYRNRAA